MSFICQTTGIYIISNTVKRALLKGNKYCKVWDGVILAWDV